MVTKTLIVMLVMLFTAGMLLMVFTEKACAAGDGLDNNMTKKGFDALANKKFKTCTWPQACVGLGSIVVMIAVVKWL